MVSHYNLCTLYILLISAIIASLYKPPIAHHITNLYNKSVSSIHDLFDDSAERHVENVRVRTEQYEMIISSMGSYTLAVFQEEQKAEEVPVEGI